MKRQKSPSSRLYEIIEDGERRGLDKDEVVNEVLTYISEQRERPNYRVIRVLGALILSQAGYNSR